MVEILHAACEEDADLIVMGTHGWKGLTRLVMGSVADKVLRSVSCPVVTVKTRMKVPQFSPLPNEDTCDDGPLPMAPAHEPPLQSTSSTRNV